MLIVHYLVFLLLAVVDFQQISGQHLKTGYILFLEGGPLFCDRTFQVQSVSDVLDRGKDDTTEKRGVDGHNQNDA